jgi:hypothetical protein
VGWPGNRSRARSAGFTPPTLATRGYPSMST